MFYSNGDKYEGEWTAGLREGTGMLTRRNGEVYEGSWRADKRRRLPHFFFFFPGNGRLCTNVPRL
jgi:hypothetical protein